MVEIPPAETPNVQQPTPSSGNLAFWNKPREFTLWQRIQIFLISHMAAAIVWLVGRTMRWKSVGRENLENVYGQGKRAILVFWHGRIFPGAWYFRNQGIVVMTSQNFDGEYIARCIEMLGNGAARGSSSRGGIKALAEMAHSLRKGFDVAFTIDGPRGPRYVAKMGPVMLAKKTGQPIVCFHISMQRKIQLKTWDLAQIPLPFTRALIMIGSPIYVSRQATDVEVQQRFVEMQSTLDRLRDESEADWGK
jgi:lysophospholipid acyltransferase (LPLAT)-like uncharacterized protein